MFLNLPFPRSIPAYPRGYAVATQFLDTIYAGICQSYPLTTHILTPSRRSDFLLPALVTDHSLGLGLADIF